MKSTKYIQDLYTENYKIMTKGNFKNLKKWRDIPCSWIGSPNIVMMSVPPNLICRVSTSQHNPSKLFCVSLYGREKTQNSQPVRKGNSTGKLILPDFKTIQSYSNQDIMLLVKGQTYRPKERIESPGTDPLNIATTVFSTNGVATIGCPQLKIFLKTNNKSRQRPYNFHKN